MSTDDDIEVIHSPLCQEITRNGHTIQVEIYDDGEGRWILETVDGFMNSFVWDHHFATDQEALDEVLRTIDEEGFESLIGDPPSERRALDSTGLSEVEMDVLEDFLKSDATSNETMMLDCLDGFLTAIVSGPTTLKPSQWFPRVWGPSEEDEPIFENQDHALRIHELIMRHMNGIIASLMNDPDAFEPIVDIVSFQNDVGEYLDGEMWAHGFVTGINLCRKDWEELFRNQEGEKFLRPIILLGDDNLPPDQWHLTETPKQRAELSEKLPESAAWIYRFWLPYRQAIQERTLATSIQRDHPKIGRNDPCPCRSGLKYKKCCGASSLLH